MRRVRDDREVMAETKNKAERLGDLWDEATGGEDAYWSELTDDELYEIQFMLWGMHQDALTEWTRRQMRKADPKR
jgi:Ni,Fe-hydrogenase III large subunit